MARTVDLTAGRVSTGSLGHRRQAQLQLERGGVGGNEVDERKRQPCRLRNRKGVPSAVRSASRRRASRSINSCRAGAGAETEGCSWC